MPSNFKPKKKSNESLPISYNTSSNKPIELKEPHKSPANVKKRRLR
jgi:hypothetical protein